MNEAQIGDIIFLKEDFAYPLDFYLYNDETINKIDNCRVEKGPYELFKYLGKIESKWFGFDNEVITVHSKKEDMYIYKKIADLYILKCERDSKTYYTYVHLDREEYVIDMKYRRCNNIDKLLNI